MDSIRFPTKEYFPIMEIPSTSTTTPFSSQPEKEVLLAIPYGKKTYLWFTNNGEDVCFSIPKNFKIQPQWTEVATNLSTQSPQPFYGTLLSGTLVYPPASTQQQQPYRNMEYFVADDIFYYDGISITKSTFGERLEYLLSFFHQYLSMTPSSSINGNYQKTLTIVLANMRGNKEPPNLPQYRVHHWQLRHLDLVSPYYALSMESLLPSQPNPSITPRNPPLQSKIDSSTNNKKQWNFQYHYPAYKQKAIFKIIPEEQCDVYSIYARIPPAQNTEQTQWVSCGYAGIFEYKTSKLLNYHCRNITSYHLDQMEESDDEESPLPPITSSSSYYFECSFSNKFRKWVPETFLPNGLPQHVVSMDALAIYSENKSENKKMAPPHPNLSKPYNQPKPPPRQTSTYPTSRTYSSQPPFRKNR
jgi:hypothetical protein